MSTDELGGVCLVVAHRGEAMPIVEHLGLRRRDDSSTFACYAKGPTSLVISGQGREAAAASVGYMFGRAGSRTGLAWLNVGVAGHATLSCGRVTLADTIVPPDDGGAAYPVFAFRRPCSTSPLHTVDRPEARYPSDVLYDMEASAFYAIATRATARELVHVLKVVSDNRDSPRFDRARLPEYMAATLPVLDRLLIDLRALSATCQATLTEPPSFLELCRCWHVTASHRQQLRGILQRLAVLEPGLDVLAAVADARHTREVVARLSARADAAALRCSLRSSDEEPADNSASGATSALSPESRSNVERPSGAPS